MPAQSFLHLMPYQINTWRKISGWYSFKCVSTLRQCWEGEIAWNMQHARGGWDSCDRPATVRECWPAHRHSGWPVCLSTLTWLLGHIPPTLGCTRPDDVAPGWTSLASSSQSCPWWQPQTGSTSGTQSLSSLDTVVHDDSHEQVQHLQHNCCHH